MAFGVSLFGATTQALPLPSPQNAREAKRYSNAVQNTVRALGQASSGARGSTALDFRSEFLRESENFNGIVKLSNCSGALIDFDFSRSTDSAMILTNGHCETSGFIPAGVAYVNKSSQRADFSFYNNVRQAKKISGLRAEKIIYATMTKTDMAIYKLNRNYDQIFKATGARPFRLSRESAKVGTEIQIFSGYWNRAYACRIDAEVEGLKEDQWFWSKSLRYSEPGCDTIGGTSGSPILQRGTRNVVGINNTGNEGGAPCSLNNPCETDAFGNVRTAIRGASYGQHVSWMYTCLNPKNEFDLEVPGCLLKF